MSINIWFHLRQMWVSHLRFGSILLFTYRLCERPDAHVVCKQSPSFMCPYVRMHHLMLCARRRTKPSMFVLKLYLESERKMPISSLQHCSLFHGFPVSCSVSPFAALYKVVITVCIPVFHLLFLYSK